MHKISIIIPLYNKELSCTAAIQSVLLQTYSHFELIIINDGSTDDSLRVAKKAIKTDTRVRLITQKNQGVSIARNNGVLEANYDLLAFLDADDLWHPRYLEVMVDAIKEYPSEQWFGMSFKRFSGDLVMPFFQNKITFKKLNFLHSSYHHSTRKSGAVSLVYSDSFIMKRSLFEKVGGYPGGMRYSEDVFFYFQAAKFSQIIWSPEELTYYRSDAENKEVYRDVAKPLPEFMVEILKQPNNNDVPFDFMVYQMINWIHSTIEKDTFYKELKLLPLNYTILSLKSRYFRMKLLFRYLPISLIFYFNPWLAKVFLQATSKSTFNRFVNFFKR